MRALYCDLAVCLKRIGHAVLGAVKKKKVVYAYHILHTNLTYELFPAVQVGGSENVVSLQWFQQKVVPDAGDTVRGVRGLRRAGGPEVGTKTLVRLCSP